MKHRLIFWGRRIILSDIAVLNNNAFGVIFNFFFIFKKSIFYVFFFFLQKLLQYIKKISRPLALLSCLLLSCSWCHLPIRP